MQGDAAHSQSASVCPYSSATHTTHTHTRARMQAHATPLKRTAHLRLILGIIEHSAQHLPAGRDAGAARNHADAARCARLAVEAVLAAPLIHHVPHGPLDINCVTAREEEVRNMGGQERNEGADAQDSGREEARRQALRCLPAAAAAARCCCSLLQPCTAPPCPIHPPLHTLPSLHSPNGQLVQVLTHLAAIRELRVLTSAVHLDHQVKVACGQRAVQRRSNTVQHGAAERVWVSMHAGKHHSRRAG